MRYIDNYFIFNMCLCNNWFFNDVNKMKMILELYLYFYRVWYDNWII